MDPFSNFFQRFDAAFEAHHRMFEMLHNSHRNDFFRPQQTNRQYGRESIPRQWSNRSSINPVRNNRRVDSNRSNHISLEPIPLNGKRSDVLAREGIKPLSNVDSSFNRSTNSSKGRKPSINDYENEANNVQSNNISLGSGWFQTTPPGSGSWSIRGLHILVESSLNQKLCCVFEPKTRDTKRSCFSSQPSYILEVDVKNLKESQTQVNLIIGYKQKDYFSICIDVGKRKITVYYNIENDNQQSLALYSVSIPSELEFKINQFFHVCIEVKAARFELSINNVKFMDYHPDLIGVDIGENKDYLTAGRVFDGLTGIICFKNSKLIFKNWKIRANNNLNSETKNNKKLDNNTNYGISYDIIDKIHGKEKTEQNHNKKFTSSSLDFTNVGENNDRLKATRPKTQNSFMQSPRRTKSEIVNDTRDSTSDPRDLPTGLGPWEVLKNKCIQNLSNKYDAKIIEMILQDVIPAVPIQAGMNRGTYKGVTFDDVVASEGVKRVLQEAVVLPLLLPEFFTGLRQPWKGVLLFGPPGTGKTMLAKAVAGSNGCTFFNCGASTLASKWRGDSEKLVRCLFDAARFCGPSVIFLDEIDSLVSSRGSESEHEASRRVKTEFFVQMDGIHSSERNSMKSVETNKVMVLAATNCPWDLDSAVLRRLEKRVYVPLPDISSRTGLFSRFLSSLPLAMSKTKNPNPENETQLNPEENLKKGIPCLQNSTFEEATEDQLSQNYSNVPFTSSNVATNDMTKHNINALAQSLSFQTSGYSGADIQVVCREAAMMPVRRLLDDNTMQQLQDMRAATGPLEAPQVTVIDLESAVRNTKPSVPATAVPRYEEWDRTYASV